MKEGDQQTLAKKKDIRKKYTNRKKKKNLSRENIHTKRTFCGGSFHTGMMISLVWVNLRVKATPTWAYH